MRFAASIAALLVCASAAHAEDACRELAINFNEVAVTPEERGWLDRELRQATKKVCGWWGASFTEPLTIDVKDIIGPSMALVPAWHGKRGTILFPAMAVRRGRAATIHEVVHVFAPNGNRFLAEGLAVHAHDSLGGPRAFPNFGLVFARAARAPAQKADLGTLDRVATPSALEPAGQIDQQANYLVAGSFVRFVIATYGLEKFRRLYALTPLVPGQRNAGDPGRWNNVYGAGLDQLTAEWKSWLAALR